MSKKLEFRITELFERVSDNCATDQEVAELETMIMGDPQALNLYQDLARQHGILQMTRGGGSEAGITPHNTAHKITPFIWKSAAAAILILICSLAFIINKQITQKKPGVIATLTSASSASWGACSLPTTPGEQLTSGQLELLQGTATLTFDSGAIISLEAPAKIELITAMKAIMHYGTAVADVGETAIGFRLDTPYCEVIDLGTSFAISVNKETQEARVDVLDGEIELYHENSNDRKKLLKNKMANITSLGLKVEDSNSNEIDRRLQKTSQQDSLAITSADGRGALASIISNHRKTHLHPDLLLAKNSIDGKFARKAYLRFDISKLKDKLIESVQLEINQVPSPFGLASFVPDCKFIIYALNDGDNENWDPKKLSWKNAPGNDPTSGWRVDPNATNKVGTFSIPKGQQEGIIEFSGDILNELIQKDSNGLISFIIVRKTPELRIGGLVHAFAGNYYATGLPPRLLVQTK